VESEKSYFSGSTSTDGGDDETETESDAETEIVRPPVAGDFMAALEDLTDLVHVEGALYTLGAAHRQDQLAHALYARAGDAAAVPGVVDLLRTLRLPCSDPSSALTQKVYQFVREDLVVVVGDTPPDHAHGTVMLVGEMYAHSLLGMQAVKETFMTLLFSRPHPQDHVVCLACHLYLRTGPLLDQFKAGEKMVELLALRLKEVKGGNLTAETRQSITDVVDLRSQKWVHTGVKKPAKRTAGQKKARAAARARARDLVDAHTAGTGAAPALVWREMEMDVGVLHALVELAQARDEAAEGAAALAQGLGRLSTDARDAIQGALVASQGENPKARDELFHALS
jgi:hypothetical protein